MVPPKAALLIIALLGASSFTQAAQLWGDLAPGPFSVGFRIERLDKVLADSEIPTSDRALEAMLWYPSDSLEEKVPSLTFRDYASLVYQLRDHDGADALREWLAISVTGDTEGLSTVDPEVILNSRMRAVRDAGMAKVKFPLVVWTMRHETMVAQSVLSEFLASHGYVVAFVRYQESPIPAPWTIDGADAKRQILYHTVEDLYFSTKVIGEEPDVDATNVAVMTWSYAAEAALRLQMRNADVRLVLGLSSNPLSSAGVYLGNESGAALQLDRIDVPYAVLSERIGTNGRERVPPEIMQRLLVESSYVVFEDLAHGSFNVLEGMIPGVFGIEEVQPWSLGGPLAKAGYESICRHVLGYLDLYLGSDQGDRFSKALNDDLVVRVTKYRFGTGAPN